MMTEPPLREIGAGGRLSRAMLGRIARRVEHLQEKRESFFLDEQGDPYNSARRLPPPSALREPEGRVRLDLGYLGSITRRVENFAREVSAAQIPPSPFDSGIIIGNPGENVERPLLESPQSGRLTREKLNLLIRRIEHLHGLKSLYQPPLS